MIVTLYKEFVVLERHIPPPVQPVSAKVRSLACQTRISRLFFHLQPIKYDRLQGALCQVLDGIGYDSGFVLSGPHYGHALVRPRIL